MKNAFKILGGNTEGKRSLSKGRHRWEDNIKMELGDIWYDYPYWIQLAQNRIQLWDYGSTRMKLRVP
jgi:hypothetical protein